MSKELGTETDWKLNESDVNNRYTEASASSYAEITAEN